MPTGLYLVRRAEILHTGDMVVASLPPKARALAAARNYLPWGVPVVKRVAATAGSRVCSKDGALSIDGRVVALALHADRRGRPLLLWKGCGILGPGDALLLGNSSSSFDGRYFGPIGQDHVLGRAELIWAR